MNVLVINLVKATFDEDSANRKRLEEYSRLVDKLFVIVWTKEKKEPILKDKLFIYPTNSQSRIFYFLDTFFIVRKILKKNKIDLILTQDPFETGLAGWLVAKIFHLPLMLQIHTDFLSPWFRRESYLNKTRVLIAKFLVKRANCLQVVSERIKNSLMSKYRNVEISRIAVLPIFIDIKKIQETPIQTNLHQKYPQFDFIILTASRLSKEKNIGLAIKAMAEVVKKYPKTGLVIIGEGPELENLKSQISNLKTITQNLNLANQIILEGFVVWEELISYYKTADLFLLTSDYEGYGMSVVEAAACGLPVVMTDVGVAGEVLENNKGGIIVPVRDKEKLTEAVLTLIENKALREKLIANAFQKLKNFTSREEYLKIIKHRVFDNLRFT